MEGLDGYSGIGVWRQQGVEEVEVPQEQERLQVVLRIQDLIAREVNTVSH